MEAKNISLVEKELQNVSLLPIIISDGEAMESIKETSRSRYKKTWDKFFNFLNKPDEIQNRVPTEMELMDFIKHLCNEDGNDFVNNIILKLVWRISGYASTPLWTAYNMLNAVCKAKYRYNMKSYDLEYFLTAEDLTTPYWIVRKVINQSIKNIMYDYYRANWPTPPSIHRGLEWPQCLNCLIVLCLFVCLSANFLIFLLLILLYICLSPLLLARSLEYPQRIRVVSVFEPSVWLFFVPCQQIF